MWYYVYIYTHIIVPFYLTFFLAYTLTFYLTYFLASILTFFLAFYLASILTSFLASFLAFYSDYSGIHSGILSRIYSDILSDILSGMCLGPGEIFDMTLRNNCELWTSSNAKPVDDPHSVLVTTLLQYNFVFLGACPWLKLTRDMHFGTKACSTCMFEMHIGYKLHVQISFKEHIVLLYSPKHHPFTSRLYHGFGHQHPKNIDCSRILLVFGGWRLDWKIHAFWMFIGMLVPGIFSTGGKMHVFCRLPRGIVDNACVLPLWCQKPSTIQGTNTIFLRFHYCRYTSRVKSTESGKHNCKIADAPS